MIVTDTIFVEGWRSDWLDATNESEFNERVQRVVDGLARDRTDFTFGSFHHVLGGGMRCSSDCAHHGQALRSDMDAVVFEDFLRGHSPRLDQVLD